jgi:hypothetical protein
VAPIFDIHVADNFDTVTFKTVYRKAEKEITLKTKNNADCLVYQFFFDIVTNPLTANENDLDHIILTIANDAIDSIYIQKR